MKFCIIIPLIFITNSCFCQGWEAEVMAGASGYSGDLTQHLLSVKTIKPGVNVNLKYNFDNVIVLRGGISWLNAEGNDNYNKDISLKKRNLNFKTAIWEASVCAEFNLMDPELFYAYPYVFGGVGIFHFNPYTYDKNNKKTYLHPLSTEGQGIQGYPDRKPYSLNQLCFPLGGGWKLTLNKKYDIIYELGYRILLTDYLDDVSTSYINSQTLLTYKGEKSAELAYRRQPVREGDPHDGDMRGSPKAKDGYFFSGFKLLIHIGRDQEY